MKNKNIFKSVSSKYDTDKTENYSEAYEECFTPIRNDIKLIFEIGVNRGGSAKLWKEFFPNAIIVGIDINSNCFFEEDRINIEIGNASQEEFINSLLIKYGNPDIVIDDGSHCSSDIKASYNLLYAKTKICYVIEDYGVQFYQFENGAYIDDGVPATNIAHSLVDELLYRRNSLKSIKVYHSICFLFKLGE